MVGHHIQRSRARISHNSCTRRPSYRVLARINDLTWHRLMRELVDADGASLPTASNGGDAPQQSEIVSRGNRACGRKVEASPPRKTWDPKRGEEEWSEGTRE